MQIKPNLVNNISLICDFCNNDFFDNNNTEFINIPCGHSFCKDHIIELTEKQFRTKALDSLKYELDSLEYSNFEDDEYTYHVGKEIKCYNTLYKDLSKIEDFNSFVKEYEYCMGTKYFKSQCPICNKKRK